MKRIVIVATTEEQAEAVSLVQLSEVDKMGSPVLDANGLMAWGIWDVQCGPDTLSDLAQIEGVELYDGDTWRQESGWVDRDPESEEQTQPE